MLKMAFRAYEFKHYTATQYASAKDMRELQASGRNEFYRLSDSPAEWARLRRQMYQIEQDDIRQHGGLTKEAWDSMYEFMRVWYPYRHLSRWWGDDLTPEQMMGF
jgi:hypothetical protein